MQIPKINKASIKNVGNTVLKGVNQTGSAVRQFVTKKAGAARDVLIKSDNLKQNLNKDTLIGASVILGTLTLVGASIKGIVDNIKQIKKEK